MGISAKGKTLLEEIAVESGWVFDPSCGLIRNRTEYRSIQAWGEDAVRSRFSGFVSGSFETSTMRAIGSAAITYEDEQISNYFGDR